MRDLTLLTVVSTLTPASHHGNACQITLKSLCVEKEHLVLVMRVPLYCSFKHILVDTKECSIIGQGKTAYVTIALKTIKL